MPGFLTHIIEHASMVPDLTHDDASFRYGAPNAVNPGLETNGRLPRVRFRPSMFSRWRGARARQRCDSVDVSRPRPRSSGVHADGCDTRAREGHWRVFRRIARHRGRAGQGSRATPANPVRR